MNTIALVVAASIFSTGAEAPAEGAIKVDSVLITLIEQVEVPAREAGVLEDLQVREGDAVSRGEVLARVEVTETELVHKQANLEWRIASKDAGNDVRVRLARKAHEVSRTELKRATDSLEKYRLSVSETEIDRLRLAVEKTALEIEQAEHESAIAQLTSDVRASLVEQAAHQLARRSIASPLDGIVVQVKRHRGEWVEPGHAVLRIVRIDRLRAEGFINGSQLADDLVGRPARLSAIVGGKTRDFAGKLVFVSPEIDPVNHQVRVWAEIENPDYALKPGMGGSLLVETAKADRTARGAANVNQAEDSNE